MSVLRGVIRSVLYGPLAGPLSDPGAGGGSGGAAVAWSSTDKNADITLSNSDLTATLTAAITRPWCLADTGTAKTTGKLYAEFNVVNTQGQDYAVGISEPGNGSLVNQYLGGIADTYGYGSGGRKYFDGAFTNFAYSSYTDGDVIGIAVDIDSSTIEYFYNNASQGSESVTLNGTSYVLAWQPAFQNDVVTLVTTSASGTYSPPSGFTWWGES